MKYKLLLLDLDGTILDYKTSEEKCIKKLFEEIKVEYKDEYLEAYHKINSSYWKKLEKGEVTRKELIENRFKDFFDYIDVKTDIDGNEVYLKYLSTSTDMIENSRSFLNNINKDIKIIAATNGIKFVQESRIEMNDIKKCFELLVTSEEVAYEKPHSKFFDFCLREYKDIKKDEILMIGDSLSSDIKGGINYGIDTCWFNPYLDTTDLKPTYIVNDLMKILDIIK